jgi:hypothetical protein
VLPAPAAVLPKIEPVRVVLLVLEGGVVAPFADVAGEGDYIFHAELSGWGKKKA